MYILGHRVKYLTKLAHGNERTKGYGEHCDDSDAYRDKFVN